MNYSHAFHAGNFADVVKHVVLVRILQHLAKKPTPFRVIDTHAGSGLYDLAGDEATRTGEWREGVGRLGSIDPATEAGALLAPYRALIDADVAALRYPGSPLLAQRLLRDADRAIFCETQAPVRQRLARALGRDRRAKILEIDGWTALGACVPPPERRGLALADPPFEATDEFSRMAGAFANAFRKWRTGIYLLWYPVKSFERRDAFWTALAATGAPELLRIEFGIAPVDSAGGLTRTGLAVANPPFMLADEMRIVLPGLAQALGRDGAATWSVETLGSNA